MGLFVKTDNDHGGLSAPVARTEKGLQYEAFLKATKQILNSSKASKDADVIAANEAILELKAVRPGEAHHDEVLNNLSVMYANDDYIGSHLMPVVQTGGALSGNYFTYNKRDRFAYPDDDMSDRTEANEINQGRSKGVYALTSRALKEYLDQLTLQNQNAPLNEMVDVQQNVLEGMAFKREMRQAAILCNAANYGAQTVALTGADKWNDASGGNPGAVVDTAMATIWRGRGPGMTIGFTSLAGHNALKRNPKLLDTFKGAGTRPGFATREMIMEYFELDDYVVGKARKDTANEGQTAAYSRIWADVFGIVRVAKNPGLRNAAFGYTLQDAPTQTDLMWDLSKSVKGAYTIRSSHADEEKIIAADTGYLITGIL